VTNGFHLFARCFHASSVKRYNFLNSNLHFKSKRRLPLGFFVELSRYCNVFHVLSKYFSSCTYHVEISKLPFLSKCRTILINHIVSTHVIIYRKNHFLHQISWRRKRTYTNCPPAKTFRPLFWRNSHLLSISVLMPCHLIFIKCKSDNLNSQCRFIITLSPQCHV